ncbi:glucose-6-phosphate dehydrogenase [Patescibacteria group bacterium]|nr:glucose-6-phosphate dehydrogenase [Patescibacteria group bacterium]
MKIVKFKLEKQYRLPEHDYSSEGSYFVTICTKDREDFFGKICNEIMSLNEIGCMTAQYWQEIPNHFKNVKLDSWVVMPNHLHGVIRINENPVGTRHGAFLQGKSKIHSAH